MYIDTPTKRYSSGMTVRLGFAVAAFLDPEILVVDEVLAVGDAEFQKKAIGKMKEVSNSDGRTVLFVSHNMPSISTLCNRAILLSNGNVTLDSTVSKCISGYFGGQNKLNFTNDFSIKFEDIFILENIKIYNSNFSQNEIILDNKEILLHTSFILNDNPVNYHITYHLFNEHGEGLFAFSHTETKLIIGKNNLQFTFPAYFFQSGIYYLHFYLIKDRNKALLIEKDIMSFQVIDGARELGTYMGREPGFIRPRFKSTLL
jgi:lipopolysaccharide transport system ATP-binding protein